MNPIRSWRQSDSFKAAVMLLVLSFFLIGYCIRAAVLYAAWLQKPVKLNCSAPNGFASILPQLSGSDSVRGFTRMKTADLAQDKRCLTVTKVSASYLADCYGIPESAHVIWANEAAFSEMAGDSSQSSVQFRGTLDGKPFACEIIRTALLPEGDPYAVLAVSESELHDASGLLICLNDQNTAAITALGLQICNPEQLITAKREQEMLIVRIRLGILSAVLSILAASANYRFFLLSVKVQRNHLPSE